MKKIIKIKQQEEEDKRIQHYYDEKNRLEIDKEFNNKEMDLTYILLVHEAPTNPCSERVMLQRWLSENGFGGEEWNKNI